MFPTWSAGTSPPHTASPLSRGTIYRSPLKTLRESLSSSFTVFARHLWPQNTYSLQVSMTKWDNSKQSDQNSKKSESDILQERRLREVSIFSLRTKTPRKNTATISNTWTTPSSKREQNALVPADHTRMNAEMYPRSRVQPKLTKGFLGLLLFPSLEMAKKNWIPSYQGCYRRNFSWARMHGHMATRSLPAPRPSEQESRKARFEQTSP